MLSIGIQLYTVREELSHDARGTLRKLAQVGFTGVEFAFQYGGLKPQELADFLYETGLECIGIYTSMDQIEDPGSEAYQYAAVLKCPYFTTGITDMVNKQEWPKAIELVKNAAEVSAIKGITLLYHNHWQEFKKLRGKYALDILLEETDAETVKVELDTGWIKKGGADPADYIKKCAGRLPLLHVRDIKADHEVTEIGNGIIDFPAVIAEAERAGVKWAVYEQDISTIGIYESAAKSYKSLRALTGQ